MNDASAACRAREQIPHRMLYVWSARKRNRYGATASQKGIAASTSRFCSPALYKRIVPLRRRLAIAPQHSLVIRSLCFLTRNCIESRSSVKRLRRWGRGCRLSALLMLIVLFSGSGAGPGSSAQTQLASFSTSSPKAQGLSSEGQAWLGGAFSSGSFADFVLA